MTKKCRFFNSCPLVQPKGYTCNHEKEAKGYCGQYEINLWQEENK